MNIAAVLGLDKVTTVRGEWNGGAFDVSYYPQRSTSPLVMQGLEEGISGRPLRLADALGVLLADWSIDWNGEPFPPTPANLSICPFEFVVHLADLVTPDVKAEAANG